MNTAQEKYLEQGSEEWIADRRKHIGSSDIAVIMGHSPYKTPYELWLEKTGRKEEEKENFAMLNGKIKEPCARDCYIRTTGIAIVPSIVVYPEWKVAMASLDGITEDRKLIVEIKCPLNRDLYDKAMDKKIPDMYFDQIQWQLLVTKADRCDYVVYLSDAEFVWFAIIPDVEYQAKLLTAGQAFWDLIKTDTPPKLTSKDYMNVEDDKDNKILLQCAELKEVEENAKKEREELEKAIKEKYKNKKCFFTTANAKLNWIEKQGTVKWKEVQVHWSITDEELEAYRNKDTSYATISYQ